MLLLRLPVGENETSLTLEYQLVRSDRRTVSLELLPDGTAVVRAPKRLAQAQIDRFVVEKAEWIEKKRRLLAERERTVPAGPVKAGTEIPFLGRPLMAVLDPRLSRAERRGAALALPAEHVEEAGREWLSREARAFFPDRVRELAEGCGFAFGKIRITGARTRWGSCAASNNLNFSCRLMLCPPDVVEYVILHELCHTVHHNHSAAFWALVGQHCPDYREKRAWLAAHQGLMRLF